MRSKRSTKSIRSQLNWTLLGLTLLVGLAVLVTTALTTHRYLREQLRRQLTGIAAAGALLLDGETEARLTARAQEGSKPYQQEKHRLRRLRDAIPDVRYVYTMRPHSDPRRWSFIVDAEDDPALVSHLGDLYDISDSPEMWRALEDATADRRFVRDRWGTWLSGYAPVKNRQGRTVAVLGLDVSAKHVLNTELAVLKAATVVGAMCLIIAGVLAVRMAGAFSRPIAALADGTSRVAQGDLSIEVKAGGSWELVALALSFNTMTRALRDQHQRLVELSNTDFLTALRNHRYFQERLDEEIGRARRHRRSLSLLMLDLDGFRAINNQHGHKAGDEVLQQFAAVLKASLRDSDVATRYGGEEFGVIMPETGADEAYQAAERVRTAVEDHAFSINYLGGTREIRMTVSGGIAEFPGDSDSKGGLLVGADLALLRAKYMSRNRVCRFSDAGGYLAYQVDPAELYQALQSASLAAVASLSQALDARDHYTRGHSDNVTRIALAIAKTMGLPTDLQAKIRIAGLLHDIGKIGIPDRVLKKKSALTEAEWALIRAHPSIGSDILSKAPLLRDIVPMVRAHHERYDGKGYPRALSGDQIPLAARILAVADAYDAMTSDRPYRPAMDAERSLAELQAKAGTQFDPQVVAAVEVSLGRLQQEDLPVLDEVSA